MQTSVRESSWVRTQGRARGGGGAGEGRLSCDAALRRTSADLGERPRVDITFRVVPSWGGEPRLSPDLGQSPGVDFL